MNDVEAPKVPRALVFAVLAVLWTFPSLGAVLILFVGNNAWRQAADALNAFRAITLEQWLAISLLVVHALFIWGACAGSGFAMLRRGIAGRR